MPENRGFWTAALRVGGPVAIVGFILANVLMKVLAKEILSLFGTNQRFMLVMVIVTGLLAILFVAIVLKRRKKTNDTPIQSNTRTVNIDESIFGDVVMGDKRSSDKEKGAD